MGDISRLLNIYDKVMVLSIYVDNDDDLKNKYIPTSQYHNINLLSNPYFIDAGFDLFLPSQSTFGSSILTTIDYKIKCSARIHCDNGKEYNTGYYLHPRSSLAKSPLRLANSTGIIDSAYRGNIKAMFDVLSNYQFDKHTRQIQLCAPGLIPILVYIVDDERELGEPTSRGDGGFGSTGI